MPATRTGSCSDAQAAPRAEVDAFLDEPGHLLRVGTIDADGFPRVVPIWFIRQRRRDPVHARVARRSSWPTSAATRASGCRSTRTRCRTARSPCAATARIVHDVGQRRRVARPVPLIAKRYVPDEAADAYVNDTIDQPRALIAVSLTRRRQPHHDVADAGRRRGRHRHLAPAVLPRRHAHGRSSPTAATGRDAYVPDP